MTHEYFALSARFRRPDPFARPPLACTNLTPPLPSVAAAYKARTAAAAQRPPAAVVRLLSPYVAHPPAPALVWGRGGGLSCADCWALCVELALVREPH